MKLDLNEQQALMSATALRFFDNETVVARARAASQVADADLWRETAEMGFVQMRVPETAGGLDAGLFDAALVCEAAGRGVAPVPLADGIAACRLLALLGGAEAATLLAESGTTPIAFTPVTGAVQIVNEAGRVLAIGTDGSHHLLAEGEAAAMAYAAARAECTILRAAWLVGAATRAIELAAAYASERKQFGKPIGSFQGIAHPLAEAITDCEGGRLLVWNAICAIAKGRGDAPALVAMADWWTARSARTAATRALRTFGGYGLSTEYDIHLYFLAINRMALADGDPALRLAQVGERLWAGQRIPLPEVGATGIEMGMGEAAEAYADVVRRFFEEAMTPDLRAHAHHSTEGHDPAFHRQLATAGFAYPDWPRQWGGEERSAMEVTALGRVFEQFRWTRVPIGCTNMGARMVMKFGTPELQAEVLPRLADGSALSCLGFTEPESGSDMYAARTPAIRDPDGSGWIISGQKMFTTGAHLSDYVLLLARTDPDAPKHAGLTIFFVPMDLPGVSIQPVHTLQDERTNITFYDEVRVPDRYRLGEIDGGLAVMAAAMEIEHGGEGYHIHHHSLMEAAEEWAMAPGPDGTQPIDRPDVRARLAETRTHLEIADLLCRRATQAGADGTLGRATGPMAKLFATESYMRDAADLVALTAPASLAHLTPALTEIESMHRQSIGQTIYGGTSEVHKSIIAQYELGMPR